MPHPLVADFAGLADDLDTAWNAARVNLDLSDLVDGARLKILASYWCRTRRRGVTRA